MLVPGLVAAMVTSIGLLATRPLLVRYALDAPNFRSSHVISTPRGAGLGVLLGILAGLVAGASQIPSQRWTFLFGSVLTLFALLGFVEDLANLPVLVRLLGQVVIGGGCAVAGWIAMREALSGPLAVLLAAAIGVLGVFYVNTANFMDGVNGISGLQGLLCGAYFSMVGISASSASLVLCGLVVSISFAAFLPWNVARSGMFLGDVGSYLLGASIWLLAVGSLLLFIDPVVALAPLVIYSLDVVVTLVRRLNAKANLIAPHREHTYQRIHQITGSHAAASSACTAATFLCLCTAWSTTRGLPDMAGFLLLAAIGLAYLSLPKLLKQLPKNRALL